MEVQINMTYISAVTQQSKRSLAGYFFFSRKFSLVMYNEASTDISNITKAQISFPQRQPVILYKFWHIEYVRIEYTFISFVEILVRYEGV